MKNTLRITSLMALLMAFSSLSAQRYLEEIFTDADITVESNVVFATNIDFLTSDLTASAQLATDIGTLSMIADAEGTYPAAYFDPGDGSTQLKVTNIAMDVYYPSGTADDLTDRPVVVYLHTGNFLPPPINGSMMGDKSDFLAQDLCMSWAKRGYVAVSMNYRLGWNPIAPDVQTRRGTLLNAVYRAIQDTKMGVRFLKEEAAGSNAYGIDPDQIVLFGEGSGGYMSQAYATLDHSQTELYLEKFLPNPLDPSTSYIDTTVVGVPSGFGFQNSLNLYRDNGVDAEIQMSINLGGALADESWLEMGDVPMVGFHAVRDDFAPFTEGTVIVPTTQEEVVDVHGSNFFIQKANDLGNNDVFAGLPDGDIYTDRARSLYTTSWEASNSGTEVVNTTPEGLFPVVQPLRPFLTNISAPWQWWDPTAPLSMFEVAPGVTTHMAQLNSNPNMSEAQSIAFQDTINGYLLPRLTCVLGLPGSPCETLDPCELNDPDFIGEAIICDNIESYTEGGLDGQSTHWSSWSGNDSDDLLVSTEQASSGVNSVLVPEGSTNDGILLLGNQTAGMYGLIFKMYVPTGKTGYFNIQEDEAPGVAWNMSVNFNEGNTGPGTGNVKVADTDVDPLHTFSYPEDQWFTVLMSVDLDGDILELRVDGELVMDDYPYAGNLGSINFFSVDANNRYYLDDVAYGGDLTITVDELENLVYSVFPNPTSGNLRVRAEQNMDGIIIRDILGKVVMNIPVSNSPIAELDLSSLKTGFYFMSVQIEGRSYTQRIVKE